MMMWSPSNNFFYKKECISFYENAGWNLSDSIEVGDDVFIKFIVNPAGKIISHDLDGMPCWVDIPPLPNVYLLRMELQLISSKYQEDIDSLNQAYLAAVVSDGPGEPAKQQAVRDAITARKAQYAADKEAARLKYPV
ncbi:tail assembly chaperone [Edwardsiella tarda]